MPAVRETVTELAAAGLVLGVVSNAQFFTPLLFPVLLGTSLQDLGFSSPLLYFSHAYRRAKPGSFLYQLAANQLQNQGISPAAVLYVGNDMLNDVTAANQVGFRTALFAGDQRSLRWRSDDPRTTGVVADIVVTELPQLMACVVT